jgi:hypothetical protein
MNNELTTVAGSLQVSTLNKKQLADIADNIIIQVREGDRNPLDVLQSIKAWEKIFEAIKESEMFNSDSLDALSKYGRSTIINGHKLEQADVGVKYDFTNCNDPEWNQLDGDIRQLTEQKKKVEARLKTLSPKGLIVTDPETGETYTIYPPTKTSKTTIKVTI